MQGLFWESSWSHGIPADEDIATGQPDHTGCRDDGRRLVHAHRSDSFGASAESDKLKAMSPRNKRRSVSRPPKPSGNVANGYQTGSPVGHPAVPIFGPC